MKPEKDQNLSLNQIPRNHLLNKQFVRFILTGGINTLFGYMMFVLVFSVIGNKEVSVIMSAIISVIFNYFSYQKITFTDSIKANLMNFIIIYIVLIGLNIVNLYFFVDVLSLNTYLAQFIILFYLPLASYVLMKKYVYAG